MKIEILAEVSPNAVVEIIPRIEQSLRLIVCYIALWQKREVDASSGDLILTYLLNRLHRFKDFLAALAYGIFGTKDASFIPGFARVDIETYRCVIERCVDKYTNPDCRRWRSCLAGEG